LETSIIFYTTQARTTDDFRVADNG